MASTNMKAVITLTADASGVQAGVNRAMAQLDRMNQAVSSLRGLAMAGIAMDFGRSLMAMGQQHLDMITNAANSYSPEAMMGANSLSIAQHESDMKLAEAFGPVVGLISEIKAQALRDLTDYLVANKESIGEAMIHIAEFGIALGELSANGLARFSESVNALSGFLDRVGQDPVAAAGEYASNVLNPMGDLNPIANVVRYIADKIGGE